jgi:hypothetical protein
MREENEKLQSDMTATLETNDLLRESLKQKSRQLAQAKQYRKHVASDKRDTQVQVSDLQEELKIRTEDAEEIANEYEEMQMVLLVEQSREDSSAPHALQVQPLALFHDGRYDDTLRAVIYSHIRAGVGKDRVAQLVAVTMQLLANRRITSMPSPATIARWSSELNALTQIQLFERLTVDPNAVTVLAHDGTTKTGKKIGAGVVHIDRSHGAAENEPKRESVAMFVRAQADGTAESAVRGLTDALSDINAVGRAVFPDRNAAAANFHGVLSDHNVTEHKTNVNIYIEGQRNKRFGGTDVLEPQVRTRNCCGGPPHADDQPIRCTVWWETCEQQIGKRRERVSGRTHQLCSTSNDDESTANQRNGLNSCRCIREWVVSNSNRRN